MKIDMRMGMSEGQVTDPARSDSSKPCMTMKMHDLRIEGFLKPVRFLGTSIEVPKK